MGPDETTRPGGLTFEATGYETSLAHCLAVGGGGSPIDELAVVKNSPMDQSFTYLDSAEREPGDYYYVRVKQTNGAWAWS